MSTILDALRKLESERSGNEDPVYRNISAGGGSGHLARPRRAWPLLVVGFVSVVGAAGVAAYAWIGDPVEMPLTVAESEPPARTRAPAPLRAALPAVVDSAEAVKPEPPRARKRRGEVPVRGASGMQPAEPVRGPTIRVKERLTARSLLSPPKQAPAAATRPKSGTAPASAAASDPGAGVPEADLGLSRPTLAKTEYPAAAPPAPSLRAGSAGAGSTKLPDQAGSAAAPEPVLVTQSEASPPEASGQTSPPAAAVSQEPEKAAAELSEKPEKAPKLAAAAPAPTPPEAKPEALGVEILNVRWHPRPERRSVRVRIDGSGPYDLNEGDTVAGVSIIRIAPASVEVQSAARSGTLRMGE